MRAIIVINRTTRVMHIVRETDKEFMPLISWLAEQGGESLFALVARLTEGETIVTQGFERRLVNIEDRP